MKVVKVIRWVVVIVLIIIVSAVVLFHLFGSQAMKMGIETGGQQALNVDVSVDDVDLAVLQGKAGVENLVVGNPPGYKNEKLLNLGEARVNIDLGSVLTDQVNISEIKIDGIELVIEQKGLTNNLQEIIKGISSGPSAPEKEEKKEPSEPSGKKLLIENLEISNVLVKVKLLPIPGKTGAIPPLKLSPIKMQNLGSDNKMDMAVLAKKILLAIAGGIVEQGAGVLPKDITGPMADGLKQLGALPEALLKEGGKILDTGKDAGQDIIKEGKKIGDEATKTLKSLIPKKKD